MIKKEAARPLFLLNIGKITLLDNFILFPLDSS